MSTPGGNPVLNRDGLVRWLVKSVQADGSVHSWWGPDFSDAGGYAYPEVGGLWLTALAAESQVPDAVRVRVARWLLACISERGRVGRSGTEYAFDSACVRVGLACTSAAQLIPDEIAPALKRLDASLRSDLRERRAAIPEGMARWSTRFGGHMLKLAWALEGDDSQALLHAVGLAMDTDGRIRNRAGDPHTYLHAACYALEGLLRLRADPELESQLHRGLAWLARIQDSAGTLPTRLDPQGQAIGPRPSDIIAQSLRLWSAAAPQRYTDARRRAATALAGRQRPEGAIAYHDDGAHMNTWCTIFALQALDWNEGRAPAVLA